MKTTETDALKLLNLWVIKWKKNQRNRLHRLSWHKSHQKILVRTESNLKENGMKWSKSIVFFCTRAIKITEYRYRDRWLLHACRIALFVFLWGGSFLRKDVLTGWQLAFAYSKQDLRVRFPSVKDFFKKPHGVWN